MNISKIEKVTINISLNKEEAIWLKEVMQNPLYDGEVGRDQKIRKTLWGRIRFCEGAPLNFNKT